MRFCGIAISGKAGSGKDTLARYLSVQMKWPVVHLADKLKYECFDKLIRPTTRAITMDHVPVWFTPEEKLNLINRWKLSTPIRDYLIKIGMERRAEDKDYWVKRLDYSRPCIVADLRFKNEYEWFKKADFALIRVETDEKIRVARGGPSHISNDPSETELDGSDISWDSIVDNNEREGGPFGFADASRIIAKHLRKG